MIGWSPKSRVSVAITAFAALLGCVVSLGMTIFLPGLFVFNIGPAAGAVFLVAMVALAVLRSERGMRLAVWVAVISFVVGAGPLLYLAL